MKPRNKRYGNPAKQVWQPLEYRGPVGEEMAAVLRKVRPEVNYTYWRNDQYEVIVSEDADSGLTHLSIKRYSRAAVREWRHLQAIKNEICGPEREAVELFPAESRLTDSVNEYHLWVLPEGGRFDLGWDSRFVATPEQIEQHNSHMETETGRRGKAKQEPWQEGLPTGPGVEGQ